MGPLQRVLIAAGGIAGTQILADAGGTPARLRSLVASGALVRVRRGYYALPEALPAGVDAIRLGGRLAGLSAADSFGLWSGWETPLTICVRPNASLVGGRRPDEYRPGRRCHPVVGEFVVHWNDSRYDVDWCWRVSVERCVRQVLSWNDEETAAATVESALTAGFVKMSALEADPDLTLARRRLLSTCRLGAGSGVETIARRRLEKRCLRFEVQKEIAGVGRVDLAVIGTPVLIEVDGWKFHSSPAQFAEDRRRDAEASAQGLVPLRFTALQVLTKWDWVEGTVMRTLSQLPR